MRSFWYPLADGILRARRGQAVALIETINHERSPVLLTEQQQFSTWPMGTSEVAFGLIRASHPERMRIVQSGPEKEDLAAAYEHWLLCRRTGGEAGGEHFLPNQRVPTVRRKKSPLP